MREFYIYLRKSKKKKVFYVQFLNPKTGKPMSGKSTGQTDRENAVYIAKKWLKEGIPSGKTKNKRCTREIFKTDELINQLRNAKLLEEDVSKILEILKSRNLIAEAKQNKESTNLIRFLLDFWDYEHSPYIREKAAYGQSLTKNHCKDMALQVRNHWRPYFKTMKLYDLTKQDLKDFSLHLAETRKVLQNRNISRGCL